jgi:Repeat of unknown function (DUF5648)/NHL repeat
MSHYLKQSAQLVVFVCLFILASCGSQDSKNTDLAVVNTAATATQKIAQIPTTSDSILLASLAATYPNGQAPAQHLAQSASDLAQNPAVLKYNAPDTPSLSPAHNAITPLAVTSNAATSPVAPVLRAQVSNLFSAYFFSIYPTEMASALASKATQNLEGTAFYASVATSPGLSPVYRFRNLLNGSYLYSISEDEKNSIVANYSAYYALEGPAWYASATPAAGYSPLYRFRNLINGTYLFTAYESEKNSIVTYYSSAFVLEGVSYYVRQTSTLMLSLVAGNGLKAITVDGTGAAASFTYMNGIGHDRAGNMYATETYTGLIRKITPAGVVTTYTAGGYGYLDGPVSTAKFTQLRGIVSDSQNNLFVADRGNARIRKITPNGVVSTFAGGNPNNNYADGVGTAAGFFSPNGIAIDSNDNLYVTDGGGNTIRKITPAAVVTTLAGTGNVFGWGYLDATGAAAKFNSPNGITVDAAGNLYVTEAYSHIRKISPAGVVTTFAGGLSPSSLYTDGLGTASSINQPSGITADSSGNVYVTDKDDTIRKITPDGLVTTVVGTKRAPASVEGSLPSQFAFPYFLDIYGGELYIANAGQIYKVNGLP